MQLPVLALEAATMFVLVRHGNTFEADTTPRRIGARTDLPLTERGIEQANALGTYFAERGFAFDRALMSPLMRTRQTAELILARQESPPDPEPAEFLREVDYGPDEDRPEEEVRARIGKAAIDAWEKSAIVPDGWIVEPEQRIAAWQALFEGEEARRQTTLLVTSNGAARYALVANPALASAAAELASLKLPTGGFGIIVCEAAGELRLEAWGERP